MFRWSYGNFFGSCDLILYGDILGVTFVSCMTMFCEDVWQVFGKTLEGFVQSPPAIAGHAVAQPFHSNIKPKHRNRKVFHRNIKLLDFVT